MKSLNPEISDVELLALARWAQAEKRRLSGEVRTFYRGRDLYVLDKSVVDQAVAGFKGSVIKVEAGVASGAYRTRRGGAMPMNYYKRTGLGA